MAEEPGPETVLPPPTGDKAAESAALNNLDFAGRSAETTSTADVSALGAAISNLSVSNAPAAGKAEEASAKKIKIDLADVKVLIEELEMSKNAATQLLKNADGDLTTALTIFVLPKGVTP